MHSRLSNTRFSAFVAVIALSLAMSPQAPGKEKQTWKDEYITYVLTPPVAGYFVPNTIFQKDYSVPVEKVLVASQRMTEAELASYITGGSLKTTQSFLLFVFPNQGRNIFLWKGKHNAEQLILRRWDGIIWNPTGSTDGRMGTATYPFLQPPERKRCYILVSQQTGTVGQEQMHTERIGMAMLPSLRNYYQNGWKAADTVVYLRSRLKESSDELLDCLKGTIRRSELQPLLKNINSSSGSLFFLTGGGKDRKIILRLYGATVFDTNGMLSDPSGSMYVPLATEDRREFTAEELTLPGYLRWTLAREAVNPAQKDADCRLRETTPPGSPDGWRIFEMTVGADEPAPLFRPPVMRHQRDGGDPMFRFIVSDGKMTTTLTPRGRFGQVSDQSAEPEQNAALGIQYRFINCGPGVMKLAIRSERQWQGTIQASCEIGPRFERGVQRQSITLPFQFR